LWWYFFCLAGEAGGVRRETGNENSGIFGRDFFSHVVMGVVSRWREGLRPHD
jgi:hypothetical protein